MSRKNESITLSLDTADRESLEAIALEYGCVWGDRPNLSELNRKLAKGELIIMPAGTPFEADNSKQRKGKQAIASIIKGLSELSLIWFG